MEKLSICRICLVDNMRTQVVTNRHLQEIYEKLTNIAFITIDRRPLLTCVFCYSKLKQCYIFMEKCLKAEDVFRQILSEDYEQKQQKHQDIVLSNGLVQTAIQYMNVVDSEPVNNEIKEEPVSEKQIDVQLKIEHIDGQDQENLDNYQDLEDTQQLFSDSDDEVPLIKLKSETVEAPKGVRTKKVRRNKVQKSDSTVIYLTKEQQKEALLARSQSCNYTQAAYKCAACFKGFVDTLAYDKHKIKHHESSGPHVCDICHMRYRSVRLLRTHANNSHARIYKCNKCGYLSHTSNQAVIHEKWHNGHMYECRVCSHKFRKPTSYLSHVRKRHPTEHVCDVCGESYVGKHGLQMHKMKTHFNGEKITPANESEEPAANRFCAECNIQFYSMDAWKRHILSSIKHTLKTEESTQCSICSWRCTGNKSLSTHMKEHAKALRVSTKPPAIVKERNLRCLQCGANFVTRSKLQAHVNSIHLGLKYNKNIVCEVCGKKCTSNATLKYHQRTHTGEKPYTCTTCNKQFADSNQLRIHTRTHTGERPYVCAVCGKRFSQKPALNRHYRVHTGVKPYSCQYCSRNFSQSNSLKLHVKAVHLKQPANSRRKNKMAAQDTKMEKNEQNAASVDAVKVFER
nr:zinc finger protein 595 [Helicoverpa armigera]